MLFRSAEQKARDEEQERQAHNERVFKEAEEKRARNTRHKAKLNNEAVEALMKVSLGSKDEKLILAPEHARKIVTAIAKGKIPNVSISY